MLKMNGEVVVVRALAPQGKNLAFIQAKACPGQAYDLNLEVDMDYCSGVSRDDLIKGATLTIEGIFQVKTRRDWKKERDFQQDYVKVTKMTVTGLLQPSDEKYRKMFETPEKEFKPLTTKISGLTATTTPAKVEAESSKEIEIPA